MGNEVAQDESTADEDEDAGVYPDETTGFDELGPYLACPTRAKPRSLNPPSQVGTMPPRLRLLRFRHGVVPSVTSTTLGTTAMASLECAAASSDGASSNVAPQHGPPIVDTVQSLPQSLLHPHG